MQPLRADMDVLANSLCRSDSPPVIIHSLAHTLFLFLFFSVWIWATWCFGDSESCVVWTWHYPSGFSSVLFVQQNIVTSDVFDHPQWPDCRFSFQQMGSSIWALPYSSFLPIWSDFLLATWGTRFWTLVKHCFWTEQQRKTEIIKTIWKS